jgi:hypothetical protein
MKLRGVPKGPLSSPKGFEILLREIRLFFTIFFWFSRSLEGAREERTQDCYFNFESQNVSLDVIKIYVHLRL